MHYIENNTYLCSRIQQQKRERTHDMRRQYAILTLIVAAMAVLTAGCQKGKESVTLFAEIQETLNGNGKVYIDEHTPCWQNCDEVFINNATYPVSAASGALARIENVASANSYQAIYPASIVAGNDKNSNSSSLPVILPTKQTFQLANGHQRVEMPMAAHLTSGNTLRFYSLCSIVRVTVSNPLDRALPLACIELRARTAKLSGAGTATVVRQESGHIDMSNNALDFVFLIFTNDCPATVEAQGTSTFDIVVPPFTTDDMTLTLYTTDGYMCEVGKEKVALAQNAVDTVALNVTELTEAPHAKLISGLDFNAAIPRNDKTKSVVFEYNSPVSSGTLLSTPDSPVPIYGNLDGTTWRVSTRASQIHANPDCSFMFKCEWKFLDMPSGGRERYIILLLKRIDFGNGFNTDSVTNMRGMFLSCQDLTGLDVSSFNTENVTDMRGMFYTCWSLTNLEVSKFNTEKVTGMNSMFFLCKKVTELDVSGFNTSNVTDMNNMFSRCNGLTSLNLSNFNTEKVTDMSYMFYQCINMTNLNLSHFDMSGVSNKQDMCRDLSTESGACTITCPTAVRTALEHGTDLPTSGVVFTWVTP